LLVHHSRRLLRLTIFLLVGSIAATFWLLVLGGLTTVTSLIVTGAEYLLRFPQHHAMQASWLAGFAALCFLLQLFIVPSGSVLMVGAGFVFGVLPSVAIYTCMQCLAIWPVYRLCQNSLAARSGALQAKVDVWLQKSAVKRVTGLEPLVSAMVLRLTPILPSAASSSIAAFSGIKLSVFFLATLLAGWVRPLFFASVGSAVNEVGGFATAVSDEVRLAPLLLVFMAVLMLLFVRLWVRHRSSSAGLSESPTRHQ